MLLESTLKPEAMLKESKKPKRVRLARLETERAAKRVFVGLSGGVDSSVAAYLLKEWGFDVTGVHLRCWNRFGCDVKEAEDARRVAEHLNISFYVLDMEKEYKNKVVDYMVNGYASGFTPNPDVICNKEIKFGLFLDKALKMGADYIATGHYVKNQKSKIKNGKSRTEIIYKLFQAKDKNKDQSYFLWTLTQEQLRHCLFPIGDYLKSEVRVIAKKAGLHTANKKDSQGLCFVGKITLKEFLGEEIPPKKGEILDMAGNILGEHEGTQFYTVGQRHGLGVARGEPCYVVSKNASTNAIVLADGSDNPNLFKKETGLTSVNWIGGVTKLPIRVLARVRYRQSLSIATLSRLGESGYRLEFDKPQKFVAPGQSAVFYSQDWCMLGGGVIY